LVKLRRAKRRRSKKKKRKEKIVRTVKMTSGSIIERERQDKRERGREKRERDGLGGEPRPKPGQVALTRGRSVALDRNRNEIILSRKTLSNADSSGHIFQSPTLITQLSPPSPSFLQGQNASPSISSVSAHHLTNPLPPVWSS
jgi:hypothetical protein